MHIIQEEAFMEKWQAREHTRSAGRAAAFLGEERKDKGRSGTQIESINLYLRGQGKKVRKIWAKKWPDIQ